jgi:hypothetical protein
MEEQIQEHNSSKAGHVCCVREVCSLNIGSGMSFLGRRCSVIFLCLYRRMYTCVIAEGKCFIQNVSHFTKYKHSLVLVPAHSLIYFISVINIAHLTRGRYCKIHEIRPLKMVLSC